MTNCKADDCGRKVFCKGLCKKHYDRFNRYGRLHLVIAEKNSPKQNCKVGDCVRLSQTQQGYCIKHYKLWKRNGTPERVLREYSAADRCSHCNGHGPFTKGLCKPCSIRNYRKGYPDRDIREKGEGTYTRAGYHLVTTLNGREYEHIRIARPKLGQVVHHKDGNPRNNDPDNLEVLASQSEHMKLHRKEKNL